MAKTSFIKGFNSIDGRQYDSGYTINQMVLDYNPETGVWDKPVICLFNDEPILRKDWDLVTTSKDIVNFVELPMGGGGGSNPLKILFTIVIGVVAAMTGQWWAGSFLGLTQGTVMYGVMSALAAGLVMAIGGIIAGMIFKTPSIPSGHMKAAQNEAASPTYSLNASNNQARLYQPIGESFGRIKIVPDRAAQTWVNYINNEMYLYQVFALGRGSYSVETMLFGDTVFWKNGQVLDTYDVEVQFREPNQAVTLFPDNVETNIEVSGQRIFTPNDEDEYQGSVGPYSANPPGTTTDKIINSFGLPSGIGKYDNNGKIQNIKVEFFIEYRRIDDWGNPLSEWAVLKNIELEDATLTPQRITIESRVTAGRYEIRVDRKDEPDLTGRTLHVLNWESMSSFLPGSLTYNQSTVALKIKATNSLSQQAANTFSVIYTRLLPEYNPTTKKWSNPVPTRKFAAAISSVLRSEWGGALADSRIDLQALWGVIDPILTSKGWTFDGYFDGAYNVWTLLLEMCQGFRVVPRISNGGVSFIYDQPGRPIRHIFTTRDIMRGSVSITYNTYTDDTPDNMIWNYMDQDAGFQQREVRATLPSSETKNPVIKSFIGVVKRAQAFQMGVYAIACNRHRRVEIKFSCEALGRLISMGDVCSFNHPYYSNKASGIVKSYDFNSLTIDCGDKVVIEEDEGQASPAKFLAFNKPDGRPWGPCLVQDIVGSFIILNRADYTLMLSQGQGNPFSWIKTEKDGNPTIWSLQTTRDYSGRIIIQSVVPNDMYHYEITAINDSDDIDNYNNLPVPPWQYRPDAGGGGGIALTAPTGFQVAISGTQNNPTVNLSWLPVSGANMYQIDVAIGGGSYVRQPNYMVNQISLKAKGLVSYRIRAIDILGNIGPQGDFTLNTDSYFETAVNWINVTPSYDNGELNLAWSYIPPYDLISTTGFLNFSLNIYRQNTNILIKSVSLDPEIHEYNYTSQMAIQDGAIYRDLTVIFTTTLISSTGNQNLSHTRDLTDDPPYVVGDPSLIIGSTYVTLNSIGVSAPYTGFMIIRGNNADFSIDGALEVQNTSSIPFTWSGLTKNTTYYFRIAIRDKISDVTGNYYELLFSPVLTVTTTNG